MNETAEEKRVPERHALRFDVGGAFVAFIPATPKENKKGLRTPSLKDQ
jgi:hypothetical protein